MLIASQRPEIAEAVRAALPTDDVVDKRFTSGNSWSIPSHAAHAAVAIALPHNPPQLLRDLAWRALFGITSPYLARLASLRRAPPVQMLQLHDRGLDRLLAGVRRRQDGEFQRDLPRGVCSTVGSSVSKVSRLTATTCAACNGSSGMRQKRQRREWRGKWQDSAERDAQAARFRGFYVGLHGEGL
jgi:hypothetical protein